MSPCSFGILFHHPFLVPARVPGLSPTLLASCSIIISWFRLRFRGLSPCSFGILFHHPFLVPARVPGLVSLLLWHPVPSSFPGSGYSSGACLPTLLASCSIIISWFRLRFWGLSPCSFGILFHHPFLVPARVPGLSPTLLASCSIIISWFWLGFRAQTSLELNGVLKSFKKQFCSTRLVPGILAFCSIIISSIILVAGRVPGIVSLFFWHSVPSSCPGSG